MKPHVHYESAFQDYLQNYRVPYVAVDETKRAAFREQRLKSFDFIVYSRSQSNWLVDIKGRRWAGHKRSGRRTWENWVTQGDFDGLARWQELFGQSFAGLFVFAYWLNEPDAQPPREITHRFRGELYVFAGVPLDDYRQYARLRSPKWQTFTMPTAEFARHVQPLGNWL